MTSTYEFDISGYNLQWCNIDEAEKLLSKALSTKYDHELSFNKDNLYINLVISFDRKKAYLIIRSYQEVNDV